jgi:hypothetical protein
MNRTGKTLTFLEYELTGPVVFHEVTAQENWRPDLISYKYYKSPDFWEEILLANNLIDIFSVVPGMILRIPQKPQQLTNSERVEI